MSPKTNEAFRLQHNAQQRDYYEQAPDRPAMQVRDTPYVHRHVERMITIAGLQPRQPILEVGAGLGKFSLPMLARGLDVVCNDLSPVQLRRLQAAATQPVATLACDIAEIATHTDQRFDRAVGFFTLHHMHDLTAVFAGLRAALKPGAELCFIEPRGRHPLYTVQVALTPKMTFRGEHGLFDMHDACVHAAMHRAGLQPLPSTSYGFAPPFVINRPWGSRLEDALDRQRWLRWAHVFRVFRARNPQ